MLKELAFPQIFSVPRGRVVRPTSLKPVSLKRKICLLSLVVINAILLFAYILGVNNYASTGYEIKALQNRSGELIQENKKLNLQISERASVVNLEPELAQSGYTTVKNAKFLQSEPSQYSQK